MTLRIGQRFKEVFPRGCREVVVANVGEHWALCVILFGAKNRYAQHPDLLSVRLKHLADPARWTRAKGKSRSSSPSFTPPP